MRSFQRIATLASVGLFSAGLVYAASAAEETYYFRGSPWELLLVQPDHGVDEKPACVLRTTAWAGRSVSIEFTLIGLDKVGRALRLKKTGWNLPVGQTTTVKLRADFIEPAHEFRAISADELYVIHLPNTEQALSVDVAMGFAFKPKTPSQLALRFAGNEQPWIIPAINKIDYYAMNDAFSQCDVALKKLGPQLFSPGEEDTSPFAASSGSDASDEPTTPEKWTFSKREEDWGDTCYVEKRQGNITIGFMKAREHDLEGFVENGFTGSVKTTWKVDNKSPVASEGDVNDYFGWHSFSGFEADFLDQVGSGRQLTITDDKGTVINFDLDRAVMPFWEFVACAEYR